MQSPWRKPFQVGVSGTTPQSFIYIADFDDRQNEYDGEEEFWITVKETGKKIESTSYSETHQQEREAGQVDFVSSHRDSTGQFQTRACLLAIFTEIKRYGRLCVRKKTSVICQGKGEPTADFGSDKFGMLDAEKKRNETAASTKIAPPAGQQNKGTQAHQSKEFDEAYKLKQHVLKTD